MNQRKPHETWATYAVTMMAPPATVTAAPTKASKCGGMPVFAHASGSTITGANDRHTRIWGAVLRRDELIGGPDPLAGRLTRCPEHYMIVEYIRDAVTEERADAFVEAYDRRARR